MKKNLWAFLLLLFLTIPASADEGMWLLPLIQKFNGKQMVKLGCKLTPEQIYSINKSSLKDAIVQFGGGCTGEIISKNGLLVTNHHCGYGSIQKLSSQEHNYLENGFWAMSREEEIPVPNLTVTFLEKMIDVSDYVNKINDELKKSETDVAENSKEEESKKSSTEKSKELQNKLQELIEKVKQDNPHCSVAFESFYNDNAFYLLVYKQFKDVRFVGAPPAAVGKFGGDTDNWMWPRHTGDFSMFRVYADANNQPAEYSKENVPYTPKKSLKISLKGYKEGDFAMVMGFPGRTQRFQTASQLKTMLEVNNIRIEARTLRQDIMKSAMAKNPNVRLQYANKYARSSNGWKKWKGMKESFAKLNIIERELEQESRFAEWLNADANRKAEYSTVLSEIQTVVENSLNMNKAITLFLESIANIEIYGLASTFNRTFNLGLKNKLDTNKALLYAYNAVAVLYDDYNLALDKKEAVALTSFYLKRSKELAEKGVKIGNFDKFLGKEDGSKVSAEYISNYFESIFAKSVFASQEKLLAAISSGAGFLKSDVALKPYLNFMSEVIASYGVLMKSNQELKKLNKSYTKGLLEWKKGVPSYPDANFTMRLTYGKVKGYSPKDGVTYNYYTTLDGVMEKEDSSNYEFRVPARLKEVYKNRDYGKYAMKDGKVPTCFLTNCDITGGNSGSPVLNAKGELIGLAFDGNWESMSSDVMFEPDFQRCICVDIRYVLLLVDKVGGASHLLDELEFSS